MNSLPITYLVLTKDCPSVLVLLEHIVNHKDNEDDIVVLDDFSSPENVKAYNQYPIKLVQHKLDKDYADHRNYANKFCKGRYIFSFDDDEMPAANLIANIKKIIANNNYPDLIYLPRKNIFTGVMPIDALTYGWDITDGNVVNWTKGDYQGRLWKNKRGLKWEGKLHERITLKKEHHSIVLPKIEECCLLHYKTINEQRADNERYNQDFSKEDNMNGGSLKQ